MKRQIFTLLLSSFFGIILMAQAPEGVVKKAATAPVVDGAIDEVWATANAYNIEVPAVGNVGDLTLGSPGETTWKALWTEEGIYILLEVNDDVFLPCYDAATCNNYEYDKPEIYFDVNPILIDGGGPVGANGHYQFAPAFVESQLDGEPVTDADGDINAFVVTDPSYIAEYFVPFTKLLDGEGNPMVKNAVIGFDVTINDKDDPLIYYNRAVWANDASAWNSMDASGTITLEGATNEEVVLVSDITITSAGNATTITTEAGTLQMSAAVLPIDASAQTVKWTVENGTGRATISSTGLLQAVLNGKVTVLATSKDAAKIENYFEVTISNQFVTMSDINCIKNGNFDADGGLPASWEFWTGNAAGGPQVIDGVANCYPVLAVETWQYQFTQTGLTALPDEEYIFSFLAWADADRDIQVDFEDSPANGRALYGTDANTGTQANWIFGITTEPTKYTYNVIFDNMVPTTIQKVLFMLSTTSDIVYLDSISLVNVNDIPLLTTFGIGVQKNSVKTAEIYPNPVTNELNIRLLTSNSRLTIYNSIGRKKEDLIIQGIQTRIDVSSYAHGLYFVKVNNDAIVKFVK